nr:pseudouridine synthase [Snodgrassella alvi]
MTTTEQNEAQRLSKRMAQLGLCSRREADTYIEKGWVKVNGKTAVLGQKVFNSDRIDLDRQAHRQQAERVTILLNKPVGFVSAQPEKGYRAAVELITEANHWQEDKSRIQFQPEHTRHLAPAGRLDIDSVGLLVLTQDGRIAKQLIGEYSGIEKEYLVRVTGKLSESGLALLNHGLSLDGEKLRPAKVSWQNQDQLRFILKQGKKRQIRRMCELVGLRVTGLKRVRMGKIKLGALPPGQWRYLSPQEKF